MAAVEDLVEDPQELGLDGRVDPEVERALAEEGQVQELLEIRLQP
jgi:hypothetical protein